jgi:hypothetical protein
MHDLCGVASVGIVARGPLDEYRFNMFMRDLLAEKSKDIFRCKGVLAVHVRRGGGGDGRWERVLHVKAGHQKRVLAGLNGRPSSKLTCPVWLLCPALPAFRVLTNTLPHHCGMALILTLLVFLPVLSFLLQGYGNRKFVFQGVHETICYGPSDRPWADDEPRINQIVFIGRNLDRKALMNGFRWAWVGVVGGWVGWVGWWAAKLAGGWRMCLHDFHVRVQVLCGMCGLCLCLGLLRFVSQVTSTPTPKHLPALPCYCPPPPPLQDMRVVSPAGRLEGGPRPHHWPALLLQPHHAPEDLGAPRGGQASPQCRHGHAPDLHGAAPGAAAQRHPPQELWAERRGGKGSSSVCRGHCSGAGAGRVRQQPRAAGGRHWCRWLGEYQHAGQQRHRPCATHACGDWGGDGSAACCICGV